jgi:hypothetical protein
MVRGAALSSPTKIRAWALTKAQADSTLKLPTGYALLPVGLFQNQFEANQRLAVIIPIVIVVDLWPGPQRLSRIRAIPMQATPL